MGEGALKSLHYNKIQKQNKLNLDWELCSILWMSHSCTSLWYCIFYGASCSQILCFRIKFWKSNRFLTLVWQHSSISWMSRRRSSLWYCTFSSISVMVCFRFSTSFWCSSVRSFTCSSRRSLRNRSSCSAWLKKVTSRWKACYKNCTLVKWRIFYQVYALMEYEGSKLCLQNSPLDSTPSHNFKNTSIRYKIVMG